MNSFGWLLFIFSIALSEGPFSILYTCLTERRKVKVWTRRYKGLRSVLAGYLVAFDKHVNLVSIISSSTVHTFSKLLVGNSRKGAIKMQVIYMQMV